MLAIRRLKEYFKPKLTFRTWSFFVVSFFIIGIAFYVFRGYTKGASANWWNDSFLYRKQVNITNGNGSDLTDFQISFSLDTASLISSGKLQSDCDDIRVINIDGSPLPHWIPTSPDNATADYACDSSTTKIWTKVPTLPSGGGVIYVYYGNSSAGNSQNGNQIFELFDDFDVLNSNWSQDSGTWSADTLSGKNTVSIDPPTGASNNNYLRNTQYSNTTSLVVESSFYSVQGTETVAHPGILFYATSGFNDHRYIRPHGGGTVKAVYNGSLSIGSSVATSYTWDEWMSHTVRLNGDTSYIYENGALIATTTGLNYDGTYGNVGLVAHGGAKNHYDYVAVRKFAATEPTTSVGSEETTQGPIAYWKFDEGVGFKSQNSIKDIQGTTTNLVTNPSFENGLTGWSVANGGTWTSEQTNCVFGAYCAKGVVSSTTYALVENIGGLTVGSTVTASVYVRAESGSANFYISDSSYAGPVYGAANSTNIWKRLTATRTVPANGQINIVFYGAVSTTGYWDGVQLEVVTPSGPQVTIYCDGDQKGIGNYAWNGTAHASSSTCTYGTDGDLYGPTWQSNENCFSEKCLLFDGTDDYVSVVDSSNFTLSEYSVGLWVKPNKLPSSGKFFTLVNQWGGGGAGNASWIVYMDESGRVIMGNHDGTTTCTVTGVSSMSTNRWSHVQTVYTGGTSGTNGLIYLNGKLDKSGTLNCTTQNSSYPLKIGHPHVASGTTENFKGLIDEVKIYNYARSADQIKTDYAGRSAVLGLEEQDFLSDGLVGYWHMNEADSVDAIDGSGNNNTGSLNNGASVTTGKFHDAVLLDGSETEVLLSNSSNISPGSGNFTMSAWVNLDTTGVTQVIYSDQGTGDNNMVLEYSSTGTFRTLFNDSDDHSAQINGTTSASTGTWYHVVGVRRGNKAEIYVNGVFEGVDETEAELATVDTSSGGIPLIGGLSGSTDTSLFDGKIDEVRLYNRALDPSEISALYNWAPGPVGYWKMDDGVMGDNQTIIDSSTYGNNGITDQGTASTGVSCDVPGKFGKGCRFNGNGNLISVPDSTSLDISNSFTISSWVNTEEAAPIGSSASNPGGSCLDILDNRPSATTGSYYIDPDGPGGSEPVQVTCDMTTDGGGWTRVINADYNSEACPAAWTDEGVYCSNNNDATYDYVEYDALGMTYDEVRVTMTAWEEGTADAFDFFGTDTTTVAYNSVYVDGLGVFAGSQHIHTWTMGYGGVTDDSNCPANGGRVPPAGVGSDYSCVEVGTGPANAWTEAFTSSTIQKSLSSTSSDIQLSLQGDQAISNESVGVETFVVYVRESGFTGAGISKDEAYGLNFDNSAFLGRINTGVSVPGTSTSGWNHITLTYDRSLSANQFKLFKNGAHVASTTSTAAVTENSNNLIIGRNFLGILDEVKIYNYARSPKQIVEDMNGNHPAPGSPIGSAMVHYRLDEGYGTTANNVGNVGSTFNGTFGTGNSAPTWTNDGKFGKALSFDGTNDYFSITDNNSLDIGNSSSATISLWYFATNASSSWEDLISKRSAGSDAFTDYSLNLLSGTLRFVTGFNAGDPCANFSVTEPALNSWHHVVATIDSTGPQTGTKSLYVDGKQVYSCNYTVKAAANSNPVLIGGDNAFRGKIDEVKIYNFVLTDDQVKVEYNQGKAIVLGAGSTGVGGTSPSRSASREYCVPGDSSTCNAPIGEWKFDEGIGSTANDTSGSGNAGTLTTGMVWTKGKIGSALDFDGVDDYVDVGDMATIDAADDLSICAWINPATDSSDDYIFAKYNSGTDTGIQFLRDNVGATSGRTDIIKIRIGQPGGNDAELETSTNSVIANQWTHVCFTFIEGSTTGLRVYVNGAEDAFSPATTALVTSIDASTNTATIGSIDGSNFFDGLIDTVRIFDYVLTPAQIAWEYNQGKPVAWYRLDECQGSTAYNAVKNANGQAVGNNGTITVGATGSQTSTGTCSSGNSVHAWNNGTTGKFNGSLSFDGSDDYVSIPDQDYLDATNNFSVAGWIKLSDASGSRGFIQKHDENITNGWQIGIDSDGSPFWDPSTNSAHQNLDGTISVADGNWHYIVGTLKDTDQRLYIDGKLNNSRTYVGTPATNSIDVQLGRRRANGSPCCSLNGQIDEVKIFNYALTPEQIKTNMAGGAVRFQ